MHQGDGQTSSHPYRKARSMTGHRMPSDGTIVQPGSRIRTVILPIPPPKIRFTVCRPGPDQPQPTDRFLELIAGQQWNIGVR